MSTTYQVQMGDRGRLVVPSELREHQKWAQGTPLLMVETETGVVVASREQLLARIRSQLVGTDVVEELLEERRAAAREEDRW